MIGVLIGRQGTPAAYLLPHTIIGQFRGVFYHHHHHRFQPLETSSTGYCSKSRLSRKSFLKSDIGRCSSARAGTQHAMSSSINDISTGGGVCLAQKEMYRLHGFFTIYQNQMDEDKRG